MLPEFKACPPVVSLIDFVRLQAGPELYHSTPFQLTNLMFSMRFSATFALLSVMVAGNFMVSSARPVVR